LVHSSGAKEGGKQIERGDGEQPLQVSRGKKKKADTACWRKKGEGPRTDRPGGTGGGRKEKKERSYRVRKKKEREKHLIPSSLWRPKPRRPGAERGRRNKRKPYPLAREAKGRGKRIPYFSFSRAEKEKEKGGGC